LTVAYTGPILGPETPKKVAQVQRFCLDLTRLRPYRGTGLSDKLQGHVGPGYERLTIAQQLQCSDVTSTLSSRVAFCSSDVFRRPPARYLLHRLASAELDRHHALRVPRTSTATEVSAGLVERVTFYNEDNGFCILRVKARGQRHLIAVLCHAATISADEGHCGLPAEEFVSLMRKLLEVPAEHVETALGVELEDGILKRK
jgi:hypothetical protein